MLPGLAADARLFAAQADAFEQLRVPAWLPPHRHESLPEYAARLAETLDTDQPYFLGGASFGALAAHEIATLLPEHKRPLALFVISGPRSHHGVSPRFDSTIAATRWVAPWVVRGVAAFPKASGVAKHEGLTPEQAASLAKQARSTDGRLLRWMTRAIAASRFVARPLIGPGGYPVPVYQVHGEKDKIMPLQRTPELPGRLLVVNDAGHMVNVTHADDVNAFIADAMRDTLQTHEKDMNT